MSVMTRFHLLVVGFNHRAVDGRDGFFVLLV
jgi:hypothetical protein